MNKIVVAFLAFAAGVGVGVLASKTYFEKMYQQIAQEEIDSVKAVYAAKHKPKKKEPAEKDDEKKPMVLRKPVDPETRRNYHNQVRKLGYTTTEEPDEGPTDEDPYVIMPEEFDTMDDYDTISLTYYADHVLVDEDDHALTDSEIEASVGSDSLTRFGEYEEEAVHVRNDRRKADYEILLDNRTFEEATGSRYRPYEEDDD